jgi:hypothetical protein
MSYRPDIGIHPEKGATSPDNERLLWQIELSSCFPDIFPEVVIPPRRHHFDYDQHYPVEKVPGITWRQLQKKNVPLAIHLDIARTVAQQTIDILHSTGIIISDRNATNIILGTNAILKTWAIRRHQYHLQQIDTEARYIFDIMSTQKDAPLPSLRQRQLDRPDGYNLSTAHDLAASHRHLTRSLAIVLTELVEPILQKMHQTNNTPLYWQVRTAITSYFHQQATGQDLPGILQAFQTTCDKIANNELLAKYQNATAA